MLRQRLAEVMGRVRATPAGELENGEVSHEAKELLNEYINRCGEIEMDGRKFNDPEKAYISLISEGLKSGKRDFEDEPL